MFLAHLLILHALLCADSAKYYKPTYQTFIRQSPLAIKSAHSLKSHHFHQKPDSFSIQNSNLTPYKLLIISYQDKSFHQKNPTNYITTLTRSQTFASAPIKHKKRFLKDKSKNSSSLALGISLPLFLGIFLFG
jgi:hypothetical protein